MTQNAGQADVHELPYETVQEKLLHNIIYALQEQIDDLQSQILDATVDSHDRWRY